MRRYPSLRRRIPVPNFEAFTSSPLSEPSSPTLSSNPSSPTTTRAPETQLAKLTAEQLFEDLAFDSSKREGRIFLGFSLGETPEAADEESELNDNNDVKLAPEHQNINKTHKPARPLIPLPDLTYRFSESNSNETKEFSIAKSAASLEPRVVVRNMALEADFGTCCRQKQTATPIPRQPQRQLQKRSRFQDLQQKEREYYTYRDLLVMNNETPPRMDGLFTYFHDSAEQQQQQQLDDPVTEPLFGNHAPKKRPDDSNLIPDIPQIRAPDIPKASAATIPVPTSLKRKTPPEMEEGSLPQKQFLFYFVRAGRDMHAGVLDGPKERARLRGAQVMEEFDPGDPPTHLIISDDQPAPEKLATVLDFADANELREYVQHNHIVCVTRAWASLKLDMPFHWTPPDIKYMYIPFFRSNAKRSPNKKAPSTPPSSMIPSPLANKLYNLVVSRMLADLSKLYQQAPLDKDDTWKSYAFQLAAGRVRHIGFELTIDNLHRLKKEIKGFGDSTIEVIEQFLQEASDDNDCDGEQKKDPYCTIPRFMQFEHHTTRKALRQMMQIWGVGAVKGKELVDAGYTTVESVRKDFDTGKLSVPLQRNQCIGLLCHKDLLEKMDQAEVEQVIQIVRKTVQARFPSAEVNALGSYRRRKEDDGARFGDVDILITHRNYEDQVPPKALGNIVQDLRRSGFIMFHLTKLHGMDDKEFDMNLTNSIPNKIASGTSNTVRRGSVSSYMGVFASPKTGAMRRIDIKFYPYRERVFASLYFTGSGYFNRSMRLWAYRKKGWTLSDAGLFVHHTETRVMDTADTEREVFTKLGLAWKEPHERDSFDAVISADGHETANMLKELDNSEFGQHELRHKWVE